MFPVQACAHFLFPGTCFDPLHTFFVPFGTYFNHVSTPRTRTTTKLLLGPLSVARGQKRPSVLPEKKWPSRRSHGLNRTDWKVIFLQSNLVTIDQTTLIWLITADYYDVNTRHSGKVLNDPNLYRVHFDNGHELTKSGGN